MEIEEIKWKEEKKESYRMNRTSFYLFIYRELPLAQLVVSGEGQRMTSTKVISSEEVVMKTFLTLHQVAGRNTHSVPEALEQFREKLLCLVPM